MKATSAPLQLIVGLGNPGAEYAGTRHNAGADFVEELARQNQGSFKLEPKFFGITSRINIDGNDVEACGNATRCFAWLMLEETGLDEITVETVVGPLRCQRVDQMQVRVVGVDGGEGRQ